MLANGPPVPLSSSGRASGPHVLLIHRIPLASHVEIARDFFVAKTEQKLAAADRARELGKIAVLGGPPPPA
jgi:hypothetical protein